MILSPEVKWQREEAKRHLHVEKLFAQFANFDIEMISAAFPGLLVIPILTPGDITSISPVIDLMVHSTCHSN